MLPIEKSDAAKRTMPIELEYLIRMNSFACWLSLLRFYRFDAPGIAAKRHHRTTSYSSVRTIIYVVVLPQLIPTTLIQCLWLKPHIRIPASVWPLSNDFLIMKYPFGCIHRYHMFLLCYSISFFLSFIYTFHANAYEFENSWAQLFERCTGIIILYYSVSDTLTWLMHCANLLFD